MLTSGSALRAAQDYEIACPQTGTTFSLKTGEITSWCRPPRCRCCEQAAPGSLHVGGKLAAAGRAAAASAPG